MKWTNLSAKEHKAYAVVSNRGVIIHDHCGLALINKTKAKAKDDLAWANLQKPKLKPRIAKVVILISLEKE